MESAAPELVGRACRRDAEAFALLIRRFERVALSVAYAVTGEPATAGDVVQDAFVRAWVRLHELRDPARFGTWLCGIVRNLAVDARRRRRPVLSPDVHSGAAGERWTADPLDQLTRQERHARVESAIQSLDELTRPCVVLRYYEGLSSREIGELLEISPAAVDMRLTRARQQLRAVLGDAIEETG